MKKLYILLVLFLCAFEATPAQAKARSAEDFQAKMQQQMAKLSSKTKASVEVQVLGKDQVLFSSNGSTSLLPASSMKLITTQVALDVMGPGYSYNTKVFVEGTLSGDTVQGNLVLQGDGDPYLVSERIWLLAKDIARKGIRKVTGGIKINNTAFEGDYRDLLDFSNTGEPFAAIVSATSLNFNSLELHVTPMSSGTNAKLELGPTSHNYASAVQGQVRTVSGAHASLDLRPTGVHGDRESFTVSGSIGDKAGARIVYSTVSLPAAYLAQVFVALLRAEGVSVTNEFAGLSTANPDNLGTPLASLESLPMLDLVRLYNTFSNNFMAEQVFLSIGAAQQGGAASIEKSRQTVSSYIKRYKNCADAVIDNGSGLSWNSRVNSKCFVELLQTSYRDFRVFADILGSLPVGGQTGTLKSRFKRAGSDFDPLKVRAKTGTLWSKKAVSAMVGFTQAQSGETIVFSILQNDERGDSSLMSGMKDWEDSCVELMQQIKL